MIREVQEEVGLDLNTCSYYLGKFPKNYYAYKHPKKVLDNINITVEQGSFSVLLGPSGSGKTTLCLAVTGAVPHYYGGSLAGEVHVAGIHTQKTTIQQHANILK